jgi:hypothetical protein
MRKRVILGALLASAAVSVAAWAQTYPTFSLQIGSATGSGRVQSSELAHPALGLTLFRFGFLDGDHPFNQIGFNQLTYLPQKDLEASFRGLQQAPPFSFSVGYVKLPGTPKTLSTYCDREDQCSFSIDPPRNGDQFILQGFSLHAWKNQNVRRIKIRHVDGRVQVLLKDNGTQPKVSFNLTYSVLPKQFVERFGTASGSKPKDTRAHRLRAPAGIKVIQGFDVQFTNGDHYLKDFGIVARPEGFDVVFNDANLDDPASVTVDYVIVKGTLAPTGPAVRVRPPSKKPGVSPR